MLGRGRVLWVGVEEVCSAVNWKKIQNGWGAVNGGPYFLFSSAKKKRGCKMRNCL